MKPEDSCVEQQRLLALVDTQKQHIEELKKQLHDTLEQQKQQQLLLVQQSPARKSVRRLLQQACTDNTALANRVEELRAQRNALCVTKAALTARVSEMIKSAADNRQREEQHRLLLHQLSQLCRLIQQPHLRRPEEQMAAVVAHVKQLYRERQQLTGKLDAAMRSGSSCSSTPGNAKQPHAAVPAPAAAPGDCGGPTSPTGHRLDQRATSKLIWDSSCSDPFAAQQAKSQGHSRRVTGACSSAGAFTRPAAAGSGGCSESFNTAQPQLLDVSVMSPLRSSSTHTQQHSQDWATTDATPCSKAPAAGAGALAVAAADVGTPLSAQSLSAFSAGGSTGVLPSPRMRKALQALSPLRRSSLPSALKQAAATAAAATGAAASDTPVAPESANSSSGPAGLQGSAAACGRLLTPAAAASQQLPHASSSTNTSLLCTPSEAAAATACSRLGAAAATPGSVGCGFGGGVSVCSSSKPGGVGLCLQPEFRLAAADAVWPSPAVARAAGSSISSHMLWLCSPMLPEAAEDEEAEAAAAAEVGSEEEELSGFGALCAPRALTDVDFLCLPGGENDSCDVVAEPEVDGAAAAAAGAVQQQQNKARSVAGAVLWAGVSLALAAAGGAASYKQGQPVLRVLECLQGGAARRLEQARECMRRGKSNCSGKSSSSTGVSNSNGISSGVGSVDSVSGGCAETAGLHEPVENAAATA